MSLDTHFAGNTVRQGFNMSVVIGFIIGMVFGIAVGMCLMALCAASGRNRNDEE